MSSPILSIKLTAFTLLLLTAAALDIRDRRIPNVLTGAGVLVGLAFGILEAHGLPLSALAGMALGLGIGFPLFALGALGAGDAKLLAAVGAFLGPTGLVLTALYGGIAGAAADPGMGPPYRHHRAGPAGDPEPDGLGGDLRPGRTTEDAYHVGALARSLRGRHRGRRPGGLVLPWTAPGTPVRRARRGDRRRGQALVEFALVVPILLMLILGLVDFARAWNVFQVITDAAREGARTAVVDDTGVSEDSVRAVIGAALQRASIDSATVTITGFRSGTGNPTTVKIEYDYQLAWIGALVALVQGDNVLTLTSEIVMRNE